MSERCEHREWTDDDTQRGALWPSGAQCDAKAEYIYCSDSTKVCAAHACRCKRRIDFVPPPSWRTRALAAEAEAKRYREALQAVGCRHLAIEIQGQRYSSCPQFATAITTWTPDRWCAVCRALAPPPEGETDR